MKLTFLTKICVTSFEDLILFHYYFQHLTTLQFNYFQY